MKHKPTGKTHIANGVYEEVRFPERLVFTWQWEGETGGNETRIIILFCDLDGKTEMIFTHEQFQTRDERDNHLAGWEGCFKHLQGVVQS